MSYRQTLQQQAEALQEQIRKDEILRRRLDTTGESDRAFVVKDQIDEARDELAKIIAQLNSSIDNELNTRKKEIEQINSDIQRLQTTITQRDYGFPPDSFQYDQAQGRLDALKLRRKEVQLEIASFNLTIDNDATELQNDLLQQRAGLLFDKTAGDSLDAQTQRRKEQGLAFNQAVEQGLAEQSLGRQPNGTPAPTTEPTTEPKPAVEPEVTVFSGCDIVPVITTGDKVLELGNITTLSYSTHREKHPVRTLGRTYARSYTRGGRTIAGTLVWTVFDTYALSQLADIYDFESGSDDLMTTVVPDQLPPFDITITYFHEVPNRNAPGLPNQFKGAVMRLYGVEIVDEGQTHGVNDLYIENVMQFVARDIEMMTPVTGSPGGANTRVTPFSAGIFNGSTFSEDHLLANLDGTINDTSASLAAMQQQLNKVIEIQVQLDLMIYKIADAQAEMAGIGFTIENRNDIFALQTSLSNEIAAKQREVDEVTTRRDERKSEVRYRTITDPSRSFKDNPFDFFRAKEL
jgi:hypothetical protein